MKTIDLFFDCSQKQALKKYISEMHEEGKKPFKCDICDQSFFKRAICQNTLLLSMILTNHSSVIFVTKFFCKEQFKETYCWYSWKEEKMWMSFCSQKISLNKNLRKHSSEVHEGRAVWLNALFQFKMLRNHSNVTFVTTVFPKRVI